MFPRMYPMHWSRDYFENQNSLWPTTENLFRSFRNSKNVNFILFKYIYIVCMCIFIYIFRERWREREGKGEKCQCAVASHTPHTGDLPRNPVMCPDWESNPQQFGSQSSAQTTELHQPGFILKNASVMQRSCYLWI